MRTPECTYCGKTNHTSIACFNKPRKAIKRISDKTVIKDLESRGEWLQANPGDIERGKWLCYLQISEQCPKILTIETLTREHVKPKGSHHSLKYNIANIKPACYFCNSLKGSRSIESLAKDWPHLEKYL